ARTAIEILVAAPDSKVHFPIVQRERQISGGMCKIEADNASVRMTGLRDLSHIERLPGSVVHTAKQDQRNRVSLPLEQRQDVFFTDDRFASSRGKFNQG